MFIQCQKATQKPKYIIFHVVVPSDHNFCFFFFINAVRGALLIRIPAATFLRLMCLFHGIVGCGLVTLCVAREQKAIVEVRTLQQINTRSRRGRCLVPTTL